MNDPYRRSRNDRLTRLWAKAPGTFGYLTAQEQGCLQEINRTTVGGSVKSTFRPCGVDWIVQHQRPMCATSVKILEKSVGHWPLLRFAGAGQPTRTAAFDRALGPAGLSVDDCSRL